ncbi:MAG: Acetate kinase, partial [Chloroflexi bacterium]|nr:Acetate kinase [Chloroflexota bacterium]
MRILTINTGSSSVRAALWDAGPTERRDTTAHVDRIGLPGSRLRLTDADGATVLDQPGNLTGFDAALHALLAALQRHRPGD